MKILIYRWNSYNYVDIVANLQAMGHTVELIEHTLVSYDEDEVFAARLKGILTEAEIPYDFVFTVNYYAVISDTCQRCGVKYVIWTCDNPLISMYHRSFFNDCNYVFTFDRTNYIEFKEMGAKHIWYLPLAVDAERQDALLQDADDLYLFANDIAFVGSLYERNTYDKLEASLPNYLRGYFDAVIEAQLNISGGNIIESMLTVDVLQQVEEYFKLDKSEGSFADLGLIFSTTVLGFKVAAVERRRALAALARKYQVAIYTGSNTADLPRVEYRGSVDYWSQMPKVFHASKINLNFTIPNIKSGLPLRIWDVLGAGGFLMTNYQAELPSYFEIGKDLVCFESEQELVEKCGYYLTHEEERREIAENGYQKVKAGHSIRARLEELLEHVTEAL